MEAEKHASGLSDETGDVGSALPRPDNTATSELAFGRFDGFDLHVSQRFVYFPLSVLIPSLKMKRLIRLFFLLQL